jgi:hypothetical protein
VVEGECDRELRNGDTGFPGELVEFDRDVALVSIDV